MRLAPGYVKYNIWVSSGFRAEYNAWLLERFGHKPDPFGDKLFLLSGFGLSISPKHAAMLTNICA